MCNNTIYDKPFKTYEQMIHIMEKRNIIISNKDFAITALRNFSYYGLINGYKNTFLQTDNSDKFIEGIRFEELYTLHSIDCSLNNILFKYILFLEKALKSRISYLISSKYGVYTDINNPISTSSDDYLYKKHYSNSNNKRSDILWKLKNCINDTRHNPSMAHYISDKNHVPAWILTTNISYGLTIEWYGILKSSDKEDICNTFISPGILSIEQTKEFIRKSLDLTKEYRNKIAHGNRTFNIQGLPKLPKNALLQLSFNTITEQDYNDGIGQNDITAVLLVIMILLDDPYLLINFVNECENLFAPYTNISIANKSIYNILRVPVDIFERLKNLYTSKFQTQ